MAWWSGRDVGHWWITLLFTRQGMAPKGLHRLTNCATERKSAVRRCDMMDSWDVECVRSLYISRHKVINRPSLVVGITDAVEAGVRLGGSELLSAGLHGLLIL